MHYGWSCNHKRRNRLFVLPHLMRAQSTYRRIYSFHHTHRHRHNTTQHNTCTHTRTHTRTHTHTHTLSLSHIHTLCLSHTHTHYTITHHTPPPPPITTLHHYPPPAHPRKMEDPGILGWVKRVRRRVEMKQLRAVWRCETNGSYFVLNLAADQTVALQQHVSNIYQSTFLEKKKKLKQKWLLAFWNKIQMHKVFFLYLDQLSWSFRKLHPSALTCHVTQLPG